MTMPNHIAVIGQTPFGLALASIAEKGGAKVSYWHEIENPPSNAQTTLEGSAVILLATPFQQLAATALSISPFVTGDQILLHTARGLQVDRNSFQTSSTIIRKHTCLKKIGIVTGPALDDTSPSGVVVASHFPEVARVSKKLFSAPNVMIFKNADMEGIELGAALGQVFILALGIADRLGFGSGTLALIITRSLTEMTRLGVVTGAKAATFSGLSGLGEVTAALTDKTHPLIEAGNQIAVGQFPDDGDRYKEALCTLDASTRVARKTGVPTPILFALQNIIHKRYPAEKAVSEILSTATGLEQDPVFDISNESLPIPTLAPPGGKEKSI